MKMVLLLVSLIEMVVVGCYLGQVTNQIGDGSFVKATEDGKFLTQHRCYLKLYIWCTCPCRILAMCSTFRTNLLCLVSFQYGLLFTGF